MAEDRLPERDVRLLEAAHARGGGQGLAPRLGGRQVDRDGPHAARLPGRAGARTRTPAPGCRMRPAPRRRPSRGVPGARRLLRDRDQRVAARRRVRARAARAPAGAPAAGAPACDGAVRLRLRGRLRLCDRELRLHAHLAQPDPAVPLPGHQAARAGRPVLRDVLRGAQGASARRAAQRRTPVDRAQRLLLLPARSEVGRALGGLRAALHRGLGPSRRPAHASSSAGRHPHPHRPGRTRSRRATRGG